MGGGGGGATSSSTSIDIYFFHLPPTASHRHPLHVENCNSNSRLVVDEDDNGKSRLERVNVNENERKYLFMQHVSQQNSNVSDKMMPLKQEIYVMSKNHSIQLELEKKFSNIYYYMHFFC